MIFAGVRRRAVMIVASPIGPAPTIAIVSPGSTLSEAQSWGKVDARLSQMVFAEATLAFPLLASYVWHRAPARAKRRYAELFREKAPA